jgi:hypothetical protein
MERMATMTAATVTPPETDRTARTPGEAADSAFAHHSVTLEMGGTRLQLPPPEELAFLAGVGVLAALEIIEWPLALVLAVGHQLAHSHHGRVLREFGEALEEA